jgi:hypothetical protein
LPVGALQAIANLPEVGRGQLAANVTLTIPAATPLTAYFLLACADDANAVGESDEGDATTVVGETNEANNCTASGATMTVTP